MNLSPPQPCVEWITRPGETIQHSNMHLKGQGPLSSGFQGYTGIRLHEPGIPLGAAFFSTSTAQGGVCLDIFIRRKGLYVDSITGILVFRHESRDHHYSVGVVVGLRSVDSVL